MPSTCEKCYRVSSLMVSSEITLKSISQNKMVFYILVDYAKIDHYRHVSPPLAYYTHII